MTSPIIENLRAKTNEETLKTQAYTEQCLADFKTFIQTSLYEHTSPLAKRLENRAEQGFTFATLRADDYKSPISMKHWNCLRRNSLKTRQTVSELESSGFKVEYNIFHDITINGNTIDQELKFGW